MMLCVCKLLMIICILNKSVMTSCSVTMMLFLHLLVKPLMTLTTVLYLSCALISGHLAMMLMELTSKGRLRSEERFSRNAETDLVCRLLLEKKNKMPSRVKFRTHHMYLIHIYNETDRYLIRLCY